MRRSNRLRGLAGLPPRLELRERFPSLYFRSEFTANREPRVWVMDSLSGEEIGYAFAFSCAPGEYAPIRDSEIDPKWQRKGLYPVMLAALRDVAQRNRCKGIVSRGSGRIADRSTRSWERFARAEPRVRREGTDFYLDGLAANGQRGSQALPLAALALVGIAGFVLWKLLSSGESETGEKEAVGPAATRDSCQGIDGKLNLPQGCGTATVTGYVGGRGSPITIREIPGEPGYYLQSSPVDVYGAFLRLRDAAVRAGHAVAVNSAFRTMAKQTALYAAYTAGTGNKAARPGYSTHQNGFAVDLAVKRGGLLTWLRANANAYGFFETVLGEDWHWAYDPSRDRYARTA